MSQYSSPYVTPPRLHLAERAADERREALPKGACLAAAGMADRLPASGYGDEKLTRKLREIGEAVRWHARSASDNILLIGEHLTEAKQLCRHGDWEKWLQNEVTWNDRTARQYMQAYKVLGRDMKNLSKTAVELPFLGQVDVDALFILSRRTTPAEVRIDALRRARDGAHVTKESLKLKFQRRLKREATAARRAEEARFERARIEASKTPAERAAKDREWKQGLADSVVKQLTSYGQDSMNKRAKDLKKYEGMGVTTDMIAAAFLQKATDPDDVHFVGARLIEISEAMREERQENGNILAFRSAAGR